MRTEKKKSLSRIMVLVPLSAIAIMFFLISLSFGFLINRYIAGITGDSFKEFFSDIDAGYEQDTILYGITDTEERDLEEPEEEPEEESPFFFNVKHMIVNEKKEILYPNTNWMTEKEKREFRKIAQFVKENVIDEERGMVKTASGGRTVLLRGKEYRGIFQESLVVKTEDKDKEENFLCVAYMDITVVENLAEKMSRMLVFILLVVGTAFIVLILKNLKGVRREFRRLDEHLTRIGLRERVERHPQTEYKEFSTIIETINDMSDRIESAERMQKQFFQNASHELRTPLMSIQGYAEGMKYKVFKDTEKACDIILAEGKRMSDLVNEILSLSKFETMEAKKEIVDVREVLYSVTEQLYRKERNGEIKMQWEPEEGLIVSGDEDMLRRAFLNLLSNALRYAASEVRIGTKAEGDVILVEIEDDGPGISEEDLPHIFERFYKGKGGNFGIGLSMVKDIVEKHEGTVEVETEVGKTKFSVTLKRSKEKFKEA